MSILGFDAIGRFAIAQLPGRSNLPGSYSFAGNAATFSVRITAAATSYSFAGNAATLATKLNAISASFAETGNAATFRMSGAVLGSAYADTGNAATFRTSIGGVGTAYSINGFPANVVILEADSASSFLVTGNVAELTRDFVNWLPPKPAASTEWGIPPNPSSAWTPAVAIAESWVLEKGAVLSNLPFSGGWDGLASGRYALGQIGQKVAASGIRWVPAFIPSNAWTVDSTQEILIPVSQ
jgi:hypothetical protein